MAQTKSTVTVYMISLPNVRNMLGSNVHVFTIRSPHPPYNASLEIWIGAVMEIVYVDDVFE